jgi:unsaturated chondroitin disaccharide hydrolase
MINLDNTLTAEDLRQPLANFWPISGEKINLIEARSDALNGAPVFTVDGKYSSRGWTEWTQGFRVGANLLQFDATGDASYLQQGRALTRKLMPEHVTHFGVHDHGFNNVSTFGNLRRLAKEGRYDASPDEIEYYDMALLASAAVQARRWTQLSAGRGYIYSFNGPQSLFADTLRSLRSLAVGQLLGHVMFGEHDERISLLDRLLQHVRVNAEHIIFYGTGRDSYDEYGRTAHEAIFNTNDGNFRCPSTQQGYSPFTTWTRGQSWVLCGSAELLSFVDGQPEGAFPDHMSKEQALDILASGARATAEHFLKSTPSDGICYWDTGAPGLIHMADHRDRPADPYNAHEPVDSSASAISAQGLLHLSSYLKASDPEAADRYRQAGLKILSRLLEAPYLSAQAGHEGLLLHVIYHRPNGWDNIPDGQTVPCGESCMWGDYHLRELALMVQRELDGRQPYRFFGNKNDFAQAQ